MNRKGVRMEAGESNVFYCNEKGQVRITVLSENILVGITRSILIDALQDTPYRVKEGSCPIKDLNDSPCIWLTSSTKGLLPLTHLIETDYKLQENYHGFLDVVELFNSAMQLHLATSK